MGADLYMVSSRPGKLYLLDETTGTVTNLGPFGITRPTDLAWNGSKLYVLDDTSDALKTVTNFPGFLPNAGDLYFNGSNFTDAFVRWDNPLWVQTKYCRTNSLWCSTYEHDLKLEWKSNGGWFDVERVPIFGQRPTRDSSNFCTAWSDFPVPYDDCETAGVLAKGDSVELSFGTYKAPLIEAGREYYGFWIFRNQRGTGSTTAVNLYGQEGKYDNVHSIFNRYCGKIVPENLWCVGGRQQGSLLESGATWSYGTPSYTAYSRP